MPRDEFIADLLALAMEFFERARASGNETERKCCYANAANYASHAAFELTVADLDVPSPFRNIDAVIHHKGEEH